MSDKPIGPGDFVVAVRWSCCGVRLGLTGTVDKLFVESDGPRVCYQCGGTISRDGDLMADTTNKEYSGALVIAPVAWLKRIPPLDELEGEKRDEEITA